MSAVLLNKLPAHSQPREIYYPVADGAPMGETDFHISLIIELILTLRLHFAAAPDVYVAGDLMFYYVEGDPKKVVSPDVMVVRGVGKEKRRVYKLWEEERVPEVVIEISSRKTRGEICRRNGGFMSS